ncbi:hypothetical protein EZV62_009116 [Acer yangbiense]|uniref:Homeobox domain-containing protein n=1 Tax=Acer yangbiense TaxID=1000413 RepID=A0A5C7IFE4_9ROSI|nr:hypothetical protein EZV62_009116 [Acer yangbiense]
MFQPPLDMTQNTLSKSEIARLIQEFDSTKSGNKNHEGAFEFDQDQQSPKKRPYHCHTQHQIQEMESFFKECSHPDEKQSEELSRELGLEPLQVKFSFKNKRAQMKLRMENEKLRADNMRYREALGNPSCPNCGGPTAVGKLTFDEHHLILENAFLRDEIDRFSAIVAKYHENTQLRMENEKLRADNKWYREALGNPSCPNCGGPTAVGKMTLMNTI